MKLAADVLWPIVHKTGMSWLLHFGLICLEMGCGMCVCATKTFQMQCFPMNQFSRRRAEVVSHRVAVAV